MKAVLGIWLSGAMVRGTGRELHRRTRHRAYEEPETFHANFPLLDFSARSLAAELALGLKASLNIAKEVS